MLVGVEDLGDVLRTQLVLAFAFHEVLGRVDEQNIVWLFALLEHQDAHRDTCGIEQIGGQADHGIDVAVREQLGEDAFFGATTEEHAVGQDDRHHAFFFEVVEAVQEEGEIGGGLGSEAVAFEAHVVGQGIGGFPAVAEGRIGHDGIKTWLLGWVRLAHHVPLVEEGVAMEDLEFRVLHPVQQHVHAGEVVGGDVLFLAVDFANGAPRLVHLLAHIEQQ